AVLAADPGDAVPAGGPPAGDPRSARHDGGRGRRRRDAGHGRGARVAGRARAWVRVGDDVGREAPRPPAAGAAGPPAPRRVPAALALGAGWVMMWGVSRHDREQRARLALAHAAEDRPLPTVVRAFVVVPALDRPTVRAVAYARALRATSLEALTVPTDDAAA